MLIKDRFESDSIKYGIVIDAGSSGSRIHIYQWPDPQVLIKKDLENKEILYSVPQVYQNESWTLKVTPGLASFENRPWDAFRVHINPLLEYAKQIIPKNKINDTPVFIQATAGMRLLQAKKKENILKNLCSNIKSKTNFLMQNCNSQIQVIDGETEGIYGWIGLNYLLGNFNNYNRSKPNHISDGFMDMGGASIQIAFSPNDPIEIEKHKEDISRIYLKSINGDIQEWDIFVSTWLGFGANEARRRYLAQLIYLLPENTNRYDDDNFKTRQLTDPCIPKGGQTDFEFNGKKFKVLGSGNYIQCTKSIYPLLLKNLPCKGDTCLFNGIHAPKIDFYKDKFVGISEYWYTANDVFKTNGEYNFHDFSHKVKEFCESDWNMLKANNEHGIYNGISNNYLLNSCFKANWVLNVLHEGFNLPRIDIEYQSTNDFNNTHDSKSHIPFHSVNSINNHELSWALGRILFYASSMVSVGSDQSVGILLRSNGMNKSTKTFIPGSLTTSKSFISGTLNDFSPYEFLLLLVFFSCVFYFSLRRLRFWKTISSKVKIICNYINIRATKRNDSCLSWYFDPLADLEDGTSGHNKLSRNGRESFQFRSRSMMNLQNSQSSKNYRMEDISSSAPTMNVSQNRIPLRAAFSVTDFSILNNVNRT